MVTAYLKGLIRAETIKIILYEGRKCEKCGEQANSIHHKVYRWKPKIEDISFLCKDCHNRIKTTAKLIIEDKIILKNNKKLDMFYKQIEEHLKINNKECIIMRELYKNFNESTETVRINLHLLEFLNKIKRVGQRPSIYILNE